MTLNHGVVAMCAAQACAQIGAFSVAAILPTLMAAWSLSYTEAGWISGIYYAAYTLVVPLLSSLTDRVDPKRVYLGSVALTAIAFAGFAWVATGFWSAMVFRALMGVGWAGSYMPGLKALSGLLGRAGLISKFDQVHGTILERLERVRPGDWALAMHYPTRWDPLFKTPMHIEDLFRYPVDHLRHHRDQLRVAQ